MAERRRLLVVQHEEQCPPAWFGRWLGDAGCDLDVRRPYAGSPLPADLGNHDAMLVLGGHMGAYDDRQFPWLTQVKALVREAVDTAVPTFGICLGHQLITVALGGTVVVNPRGQQIGVLPIGWGEEPDELLGGAPGIGIQWNNDVVQDLPDGAVALARTPAGELQAARFAPAVWGVQAHPEADRHVVQPWADEDRRHQGDAVVDAALGEVEAAEAELLAGWEKVAAGFAGMVRRGR